MSSRKSGPLRTRGWSAWFAAAVIGGLARTAGASEPETQLGWLLEAGAAATDNAALSEVAVSDVLASVGGSLDIETSTRRLDLAVSGFGSQIHYVDGTFDDNFVGRLDGVVSLAVVPERLSLVLEDHFGQIATDQFAPVTPENRQNVNTLVFGPDASLRLGSSNIVRLSGRVSDSRFEDSSELDVRATGGTLSLLRELSPTSRWGAAVSVQEFDFAASAVPSYTQTSANLTATLEGSRQQLTADLGVSRIERLASTRSTPLVRLAWNRRLSSSWTMQADAVSDFQNASQQAVNRSSLALPGASGLGLTDTPAQVRFASLGFSFARSRTRLLFSSGIADLDYQDLAQLDEKSYFALVEINRRIRPSLSAVVRFRWDDRRYPSGQVSDDEQQALQLALEWNAGRSTFLALGYRSINSDSDSAAIRFDSNVTFLKVSYRRGNVSDPVTFQQ